MTSVGILGEPAGQGWVQLWELFTALVLSSLIGLERELKQKAAGLRTHTLVGLGSALFMLVSKYGFTDLLGAGGVSFDPSRVAAQIVSGIGFVGGGLIFVRRDVVRGLTTAAVVWVTAAIGMACGAGLPLLAVAVTVAHFLVLYGYPQLMKLAGRRQAPSASLRLRYLDGRGVLREILRASTQLGFSVLEVDTEPHVEEDETTSIALLLRVSGRPPVHELISLLSEVDGVRSVGAEEGEE
jgi:putative Mg2+ transporter-C (MgtC) family protein